MSTSLCPIRCVHQLRLFRILFTPHSLRPSLPQFLSCTYLKSFNSVTPHAIPYPPRVTSAPPPLYRPTALRPFPALHSPQHTHDLVRLICFSSLGSLGGQYDPLASSPPIPSQASSVHFPPALVPSHLSFVSPHLLPFLLQTPLDGLSLHFCPALLSLSLPFTFNFCLI